MLSCTVWKFQHFLPLRFYVKSIFGIPEVPKLPFRQFWGSGVRFWWLLAFLEGRKLPKINFWASETVKMADFELLDSLKLISRKIWVANCACVQTFHNFISGYQRKKVPFYSIDTAVCMHTMQFIIWPPFNSWWCLEKSHLSISFRGTSIPLYCCFWCWFNCH